MSIGHLNSRKVLRGIFGGYFSSFTWQWIVSTYYLIVYMDNKTKKVQFDVLGGSGNKLNGRSASLPNIADLEDEPKILFFSGGTALNSIVNQIKSFTTNVTYIMPISGTSITTIRLVGRITNHFPMQIMVEAQPKFYVWLEVLSNPISKKVSNHLF